MSDSDSLNFSVPKTTACSIKLCPNTLFVDCRSQNDFDLAHISGAISLSFPNILWRRILKQKARPGCLDEFLMCDAQDLKRRHNSGVSVVLYDLNTLDVNDLPSDAPLRVLCEMLQLEDGTNFSFLEGGFKRLKCQRPELLVSTTPQAPPRTLSGCPSPNPHMDLFINPSASYILDFMIIGSESNAQDLCFLDREKITHVLNLTSTPSKPEVLASRVCLQIKLLDSPTQDILAHIPAAIDFIHSARACGGRILVHCLAGISRSSAMATAYLMWDGHYSHLEAFEIVRAHRPCASPNLNFMGQLMMFGRCLCCRSSKTSTPKQACMLAVVCLRKQPPASSKPLMSSTTPSSSICVAPAPAVKAPIVIFH